MDTRLVQYMCSIDFHQFFDLVQSICAVITTGFAVTGVHQWKKETAGRRRIDLAEEAFDLFSKFPNVISNIRCFVARQDEGKRMTTSEPEEPNLGHIALERLQKHQDYLERVSEIRGRFLMYFGKDKDEFFSEVFNIVRVLKIEAEKLAFSSTLYRPQERFEMEKILTFPNHLENEITQRAESVSAKMMQFCQQIIPHPDKAARTSS